MSVATSEVITDIEPIAMRIAAIVFDLRFLFLCVAFFNTFFSFSKARGFNAFTWVNVFYPLWAIRCHLCMAVAVRLRDDLRLQFAMLHSRQEVIQARTCGKESGKLNL